MSALIAAAAALGLIGLGMLVSPEMSRLRKRRQRRRRTEEAVAPPPAPVPEETPTLHVIHGDGGTVVPFPQRSADTFSSPPPPYGVDGPDAA